eukprot:CAMPEP_0170569078 /NCGR_PEP_ID=MMETSP0224-20130122/333_1 /TAXON_ID=285029 /ORGANISM="Togula jolla, Strain CCCM 725" /LENGTH=145 /DNA_ID=CAMNT_0010891161 /DNA_START=210 /DNA_END=647 /DNA_ORIENTATION=+
MALAPADPSLGVPAAAAEAPWGAEATSTRGRFSKGSCCTPGAAPIAGFSPGPLESSAAEARPTSLLSWKGSSSSSLGSCSLNFALTSASSSCALPLSASRLGDEPCDADAASRRVAALSSASRRRSISVLASSAADVSSPRVCAK